MGEQNRLFGLDALRGIAALVVFFYHATYTPDRIVLFHVGYLAVDLFFMLSGYVMARTYEQRLREGWPVQRFMLKRFRRLWLPFAVGCSIGLVFLLTRVEPAIAIGAFALALLFLPNPFSPMPWSINGPGWSLFFELIANLVHALAFAKLSTGWLCALLAVCAAGLMLITLQVGYFAGPATFADFPAVGLRTAVSYLFGIIIFRVVADRPSFRIPGPFIVFPALIMLGSCLPREGVFSLLFVLGICPAVLIGALRAEFGPRTKRLAEWSGKLSYPLYAVHGPVLFLLQPAGIIVAATSTLAAAAALTVALEARGTLSRQVDKKRMADIRA